MKHINFIENKSFKWSRFELNYFWLAVIMASLVFGSLIFSVIQAKRIEARQKRQAEILVEINKLKALWALNNRKDDISDTAAMLLNKQIMWGELIGDISAQIPSSVRLSQISATLSGKKILKIIGHANRIASVMKTKRNLEKLKWCKKVDLIHMKKDGSRVGSLSLDFKMECLLL